MKAGAAGQRETISLTERAAELGGRIGRTRAFLRRPLRVKLLK
jgi:hypothetical protein